MESSVPQKQLARRKWATALWGAQVLASFGAWLAAAIEFESIVFTGPLLAVIGLALAVVTRPMGSTTTLLFSLSAPVVIAMGAFAIALFQWHPEQAYVPIVMLLSIYMLLFVPAAIFVLVQILQWPAHSFLRAPRVWRYSLKSLLGLMTAVALVSALLASFAEARYAFPLVFGIFGSAAVAMSAIIAWDFYTQHGRFLQTSTSPPSFRLRTWLESVLRNTSMAASGQARCSFCGRSHEEAGPFVEGRDGSLICRQCAEACGKLISNKRVEPVRDEVRKKIPPAEPGADLLMADSR